jgi:hypothetical protein
VVNSVFHEIELLQPGREDGPVNYSSGLIASCISVVGSDSSVTELTDKRYKLSDCEGP